MQPTLERAAVVYWLFDVTCVDPRDSGYVGVTTDLPRRLQHHHEGGNSAARDLPAIYKARVLYKGLLSRCLDVERQLRPRPGIGWNRLTGGGYSGERSEETKQKISSALVGVGKGIPKSPAHREAMRQAQLRAIANDPKKFAAKFAKMRAARALKDHSGINSGPKSEAHKQKLRISASRFVCKYGHVKPFGKPCPECRRERKRRYRERLKLKTSDQCPKN